MDLDTFRHDLRILLHLDEVRGLQKREKAWKVCFVADMRNLAIRNTYFPFLPPSASRPDTPWWSSAWRQRTQWPTTDYSIACSASISGTGRVFERSCNSSLRPGEKTVNINIALWWAWLRVYLYYSSRHWFRAPFLTLRLAPVTPADAHLKVNPQVTQGTIIFMCILNFNEKWRVHSFGMSHIKRYRLQEQRMTQKEAQGN